MMAKFDYEPNYIGNQTKNLNTFFNWCVKVKRIQLSPYHVEMTVDKILVDKIFLTIEEIAGMREVVLPDYLDRVRDVFLFGCYTELRYSDLNRLSKMNILERKGVKVLSFVPQKTNSLYQKSHKKIEVALIPQAVEIIERYKETHAKVLPVISNQKMNEYLRIIGEKAGINDKVEVFPYKNNQSGSEEIKKYKLITCHSARHTFATQSLSRGVPIEVVQQLMGYSDKNDTDLC
jgi:integrase/recombinase XerD